MSDSPIESGITPNSPSSIQTSQATPNCRIISKLTTSESVLGHLDQLSDLLQECVGEGNSIGFLGPLSMEDAKTYWTQLIPSIENGSTHLFVVAAPSLHGRHSSHLLLGTAQLAFIPKASHSHRADVNKLIVSTSHKRLGIARKLMEHLEDFARSEGKEVLTLSTAKDSVARKMYLRFGWEEFGICKAYASLPDGRRTDVSFFSKDLTVGSAREAAPSNA